MDAHTSKPTTPGQAAVERVASSKMTERQRARHACACREVIEKQRRAGVPTNSMDELWPKDIVELMRLWREAHAEEEILTTRGLFDALV